jgi:hypothetical protein
MIVARHQGEPHMPKPAMTKATFRERMREIKESTRLAEQAVFGARNSYTVRPQPVESAVGDLRAAHRQIGALLRDLDPTYEAGGALADLSWEPATEGATP